MNARISSPMHSVSFVILCPLSSVHFLIWFWFWFWLKQREKEKEKKERMKRKGNGDEHPRCLWETLDLHLQSIECLKTNGWCPSSSKLCWFFSKAPEISVYQSNQINQISSNKQSINQFERGKTEREGNKRDWWDANQRRRIPFPFQSTLDSVNLTGIRRRRRRRERGDGVEVVFESKVEEFDYWTKVEGTRGEGSFGFFQLVSFVFVFDIIIIIGRRILHCAPHNLHCVRSLNAMQSTNQPINQRTYESTNEMSTKYEWNSMKQIESKQKQTNKNERWIDRRIGWR